MKVLAVATFQPVPGHSSLILPDPMQMLQGVVLPAQVKQLGDLG